jgi:hypothetical protein
MLTYGAIENVLLHYFVWDALSKTTHHFYEITARSLDTRHDQSFRRFCKCKNATISSAVGDAAIAPRLKVVSAPTALA